MDQMSADLHGVVIKLKTTQPKIVYNAIKMQIMLKFLTEDGQLQVFFIILLVFLSTGKPGFNQMWPLTPLIDKFYACKSPSI